MALSVGLSAGLSVGSGVGSGAGLRADMLVRRRDFVLEASLTVADGETLALLGPNGSGKSTLLATIAGLIAPERGTIEVNGRMLTRVGVGVGVDLGAGAVARAGAGDGAGGPASGGGRDIHIPPHERGVGLLGQDPLLFPHLSARENVAFGLRASGVSASSARAAADAWLHNVGLAELADRLPAQLSGGQQQKVAIGRALAAKPHVLLLDEPVAALDVQNAAAVRTLLREHLATTSIPTIVVTHDVVDAMVLADRVAIVEDGRIVDIGDPSIVLGQPLNEFAAQLVGLNLMVGTLSSDGAVECGDGRRVRSAARGVGPGDNVTAAFPPSAVRIVGTKATAGDNGDSKGDGGRGDGNGQGDSKGDSNGDSNGFSWQATVGAFEPAVAGIRVPFVGESFAAELTTAELLASGVREGMRVTVTIDPELVTVYRSRQAVAAMRG